MCAAGLTILRQPPHLGIGELFGPGGSGLVGGSVCALIRPVPRLRHVERQALLLFVQSVNPVPYKH